MAISRDKVLKEAEKLVQKGKLDGAIRQYEKLLKTNPNDVTIINRVGDLYGKVGQIDKAAIELYERIAEFFIQDGFVKKAIAVFKKINRMAPQRLDVFEKLAELYLELSLTGEAKTQYQILADWYSNHGDPENALRIQRKLAEVEPGNHVVQLRLADMLMEAGEREEGLRVFSQLLHVLLDRHKIDEAERLARHILELGPPQGGFVAPVCEKLLKDGKRGAAQDLVEAGLALSPEDAELKSLKLRLSMGDGDLDEMPLDAAESLLQADPENSKIRRVVGERLVAAGQAEQARDVLAPLIESCLQRGDLRSARELTDELRTVLPGDRKVLQWSLRIFEATGQREGILEVKAALAGLYYDEGRLDVAQQLYMELADLDPENATFRQRLLELSARGYMGDVQAPSGAVHAPGEAVRPVPSPPGFDPEERLGEARVFAKYGLADKAVRHLDELLQFFPEHEGGRRELVRILVEDGQLERAREVAVPLGERYRAASDQEGMAWLREVLGAEVVANLREPVAPDQVEELGEQDEEEILFLDFDAEDGSLVEMEAAGEPAGAREAAAAASFESGGVLELELDDRQGLPDIAGATAGTGAGDEGSGAMPGEAAETGHEAMLDLDALGIGLEESRPAEGVSSDSLGGLRAGEMEELDMSWVDDAIQLAPGITPSAPVPPRPEPPAEAPQAPGVPEGFIEAPGEAVELLDITGVVEGPPWSDLERLDFFISEELFQDAARILAEMESNFPGDPELAERRLRLKEKGVILMEARVPQEEQAEDLFSEEELYVDLASELEKELAAEEAMVEEATGHGKGEALLEEVFKEFQRGVAEQLSEEDSDTHFNLGIAYKEMGLLPEAIGEFQIAARDPSFHLEGCSMIAVCYVEQGLYDEAARWYEKALAGNGLTDDARAALHYDLGMALVAAGRDDEAHAALSEVAAIDPSYRDVGTQLQSLARHRRAN